MTNLDDIDRRIVVSLQSDVLQIVGVADPLKIGFDEVAGARRAGRPRRPGRRVLPGAELVAATWWARTTAADGRMGP